LFADVPLGVFLIRGENVVLLGEVDLEMEDDIPRMAQLQMVDVETVKRLNREEMEKKRRSEKLQHRILRERGYGVDMNVDADAF
jgi:U6 snRNA-associated Sm-like protein LSm1